MSNTITVHRGRTKIIVSNWQESRIQWCIHHNITILVCTLSANCISTFSFCLQHMTQVFKFPTRLALKLEPNTLWPLFLCIFPLHKNIAKSPSNTNHSLLSNITDTSFFLWPWIAWFPTQIALSSTALANNSGCKPHAECQSKSVRTGHCRSTSHQECSRFKALTTSPFQSKAATVSYNIRHK